MKGLIKMKAMLMFYSFVIFFVIGIYLFEYGVEDFHSKLENNCFSIMNDIDRELLNKFRCPYKYFLTNQETYNNNCPK